MFRCLGTVLIYFSNLMPNKHGLLTFIPLMKTMEQLCHYKLNTKKQALNKLCLSVCHLFKKSAACVKTDKGFAFCVGCSRAQPGEHRPLPDGNAGGKYKIKSPMRPKFEKDAHPLHNSPEHIFVCKKYSRLLSPPPASVVKKVGLGSLSSREGERLYWTRRSI